MILKLASALSGIFVTFALQAQVSIFTGDSGEKLIIQQTPDLGKDVALIKFEGVPQSTWQKKVIKVQKSSNPSGDRYNFDYVLELSSGKHPKSWQILVESGSKLIKATSAKRMQIFIQGSKNPVEVFHDLDLTKTSQDTDLTNEYKKSPFKPRVE